MQGESIFDVEGRCFGHGADHRPDGPAQFAIEILKGVFRRLTVGTQLLEGVRFDFCIGINLLIPVESPVVETGFCRILGHVGFILHNQLFFTGQC